MTALIIIIIGSIVVAHLVLGPLLGRLSWHVWHSKKYNLLSLLIFPESFQTRALGSNSSTFIHDYHPDRRESYLLISVISLVPKTVWMTLAGTFHLLGFLLRVVVIGPGHAVSAFRYVPVEASKEVVEEPVEVDGAPEEIALPEDVRLVLEHRAKLEEKARIDARLAEIESMPDFEKMQANHVRH